MLTLHCTKRSPYARKVRVVALEKGINLHLAEADLQNKSPHLLAMNPLGKIPVLERPEGAPLSDSSLICEYLNILQPKPPLWPTDTEQRLVLQNLDALAKGLMDVTVSIFYERLLHKEDSDAGFLRRQSDTVLRCLSYFDARTADLEPVSMASIAIVCAIGYIGLRSPELWEQVKAPALKAWHGEMSQRKSFQQTIPVTS